jgi:predicted nucleic acid-binding protein
MRPPARLVVDASVAVKWVIDEPGTAEASLLLDCELVAPDLLCAECANILWKKAARRELSADQVALAAETLEGMVIELVPMRSYLAAATALAVELDHPAYDCVYLATALDLSLSFVTADERLIRKIRQSRHPVGDRLVALSEVPDLL